MKETAQHRHYFLSKGMKSTAHNPEAVMFITTETPRTERTAILLIGPGGNWAFFSNNLHPRDVPCYHHLNGNLMLHFCHHIPIDLPGKQINRCGDLKGRNFCSPGVSGSKAYLFAWFFLLKYKIVHWHLVNTVLQKDRRGCNVFCQVNRSSSCTHFTPFTSFETDKTGTLA